MPQTRTQNGATPGGERYNLPLGLGDVQYLWLLVAAEVLTLYLLRVGFKSSHGG